MNEFQKIEVSYLSKKFSDKKIDKNINIHE